MLYTAAKIFNNTIIHQTVAFVVRRHRMMKGVRHALGFDESVTRSSRNGSARRIQGIRLVVEVTRRRGKLAQAPVPRFISDSASAIGGATIGLQNLGAYLLRDQLVDGVKPRVCDSIYMRRECRSAMVSLARPLFHRLAPVSMAGPLCRYGFRKRSRPVLVSVAGRLFQHLATVSMAEPLCRYGFRGRT